jgi:hypothetical protein
VRVCVCVHVCASACVRACVLNSMAPLVSLQGGVHSLHAP